ncbi:site-specific DNA-methyltransferase [Weissella cibaria]|uniref:site-specific DNA-methyltransferase n=1 Tax=Weissella cibaria TaxID=137591 RepID=UPI00119216EE|nr:site-specific DNA-methyltransferase [Weissella cibaria]TVV24588.1 site-specific DNA-methyltransferase [Weissella cibaria]
MFRDNFKHNDAVRANTAFLDELKAKLPEYFTNEGSFDLEKLQINLREQNIEELSSGNQLQWIGKDYAKKQAGEKAHTVVVPDLIQNQKIENANSKNLFFTGDNLEVLRHLKSVYENSVDFIYIDPPYNTGSDGFAYPDNFEYSDEQMRDMFGITDEQLQRLKSIQGRSSHSAWLTFMYPRLFLAKKLLKSSGVIFISIDDNEQANLRELMDEIFGEASMFAQLAVEMSKTQGMKVAAAKRGQIVKNKEYVIGYAKNINQVGERQPIFDHVTGYDTHYQYYRKTDGTLESVVKVMLNVDDLQEDLNSLQSMKKFSLNNLGFFLENSDTISQWIYANAKNIYRRDQAAISIPEEILDQIREKELTEYNNDSRTYLLTRTSTGTIEQAYPLSDNLRMSDDYNPVYGRSVIRGDWWPGFATDMGNISKEDGIEYKNGKKPVRLIKQLIKWANVKNGIVLDFFAGSGTTGSAVLWDNVENNSNNQFILVQLPENLDDRLINADTEGKKQAKALIKMLDKVGRGHSIDEMTQQRIQNAVSGIKVKYDSYSGDLGFKHYQIIEPIQKALEEIENFSEVETQSDLFDNMVTRFSAAALGVKGDAEGVDTLLATSLMEDGYDFDTVVDTLKFGNYEAKYVDNTRIYLFESNWGPNQTKELVNLVGTNKLSIQTVVVYGYSFAMESVRELEIALNQLEINVNLQIRY